ncbi:MAG: GGDEF domain-containing protein [Methylobacter sp.]|nr:GGDEF domain-containing protein [Methylobacter sp.]
MNLDVRTIIVMMSALSLLFSALLALAGLRVNHYRGIWHWAAGSLFIGLGFAAAYFQEQPPFNFWFVVFGSTLIALGLGMQFNGITAFKTDRCNRYIPLLITALVFIVNTWFAIISPDINARVIFNSLVFGLFNGACARALLIRIEQPLRTAYWFTGASFAVLAILLLLRSIMAFLAPPDSYGIYSHSTINPLAFFVGNIAQLCITFGLVLMLNYRLSTDLQKQASIDVLTGALNRRSLEQEADRLSARCLRTGDTLAVLMIDVDHFKSINDHYGHPVGDEVLKRLAALVQQTIRSDDYFARYGGEEFCIMLPSTGEQEAWLIADRLRQNYEELIMEFEGETLRSTISIGVADSLHAGIDFSTLIAAADKAMYQAKQQGRNRVVMYAEQSRVSGNV